MSKLPTQNSLKEKGGEGKETLNSNESEQETDQGNSLEGALVKGTIILITLIMILQFLFSL